MINDQEFFELYQRYEPERRNNYISIDTKVEKLVEKKYESVKHSKRPNLKY